MKITKHESDKSTSFSLWDFVRRSASSACFSRRRKISEFACVGLLVLVAQAGPHPCAAQTTNSSSAQIQEHLRRAQSDLNANSAEKAAKEFEAILAIDKSNATALANLGALAFVRGDYRAAASDFQQALQSDPTLSKARALLAISEKRLADPSAQSLLETSFSQVEDKKIRTQVGMELADSYYRQGDLEHASGTVGALLQLNPDDADVLYMAQRVYQEMADGALNKLAILAPKSARMQQVIAEHLINAGNLSGAIEHYRMALKINPRLPGVHYEIGESLMQLSTTESTLNDAQDEFSEAIRTEGDSAGVEVRLGMIAAMRGQPDAAYAHYAQAYALNSSDPDAQLGLARSLMDRGKPGDAMPYLRNVVNTDPMNTEARYRLAKVYKQVGLVTESNQQMTLFRESKALRSQVEEAYAQMNRPERKRPDEISGEDN
jgi:tetratricopeptide (TPR) repeat protein